MDDLKDAKFNVNTAMLRDIREALTPQKKEVNPRASGGVEKAEGRRQKAEGRRQKAEGRRQKDGARLTGWRAASKFCHPERRPQAVVEGPSAAGGTGRLQLGTRI